MQEFIMMIGLPGSGKDTYINNFDKNQYVVISSDQIRKDLNYKAGEVKDVFDICREQIRYHLTLGKNIIFNATNINRKHRMNLLDYLHGTFNNISYSAYVVTTPIKVCKERNSKREGFDKVPEEVIDKMLRAFQIPMEKEGFDFIGYVMPGFQEYCEKDSLQLKPQYQSIDFNALDNFDQENIHHSLTLGQHMAKAQDYVEQHLDDLYLKKTGYQAEVLKMAAYYHDIGKVLTKDYHDSRGNKTEHAHYYGHENAGAYFMLSEGYFLWGPEYGNDFIIKVATFINFHMRVGYTWKQYPEGKCAKREKKLFSDLDLKYLELLREADNYAH